MMTRRMSRMLKAAWSFDEVFQVIRFPARHGLRRTVSQVTTGMLIPRIRWRFTRSDQLRLIRPRMNSPVRYAAVMTVIG